MSESSISGKKKIGVTAGNAAYVSVSSSGAALVSNTLRYEKYGKDTQFVRDPVCVSTMRIYLLKFLK